MDKDKDFFSNFQDKKNKRDDINSTNNKTAGTSFKPIEKKKVPEKVTRNNHLKIGISSAVVLLIIIILFIILTGGVKVKDFSGWSKNDVVLWAQQNNVNMKIEEAFDENIEAGMVVKQSIPNGKKIAKGDELAVVISLGPDLDKEFELPDLMSMTKTEVEDWVEQNKLTKVRITAEYSKEVEAGKVISYEVNDARVVDKIKRDSPVYVVVSKGVENLEQKKVKVPNFKTMTQAEIATFAKENEITIKTEEEYDKYTTKGEVSSQSIKANEFVNYGGEITLTISLGEEQYMPSFASLTESQALAKANQYGLIVTTNKKYAKVAVDDFVEQSVAEGTPITDETILELTYSLGKKIVASNLVGSNELALEQWLDEENKKGAKLTVKKVYTQNDRPKGIILNQDKKDEFVSIGQTITVVISSGSQETVPDFVRQEGIGGYNEAITRKKAETLVKDKDITLIFEEAVNENRLPGEIWSQSVVAGVEVEEGTMVVLKYNPLRQGFSVPDFTGKTVEEIEAMDAYYNFLIKFKYVENDDNKDGCVYGQSIDPNTVVGPATEIKLLVAKNSEEQLND